MSDAKAPSGYWVAIHHEPATECSACGSWDAETWVVTAHATYGAACARVGAKAVVWVPLNAERMAAEVRAEDDARREGMAAQEARLARERALAAPRVEAERERRRAAGELIIIDRPAEPAPPLEQDDPFRDQP